MGSRLEKNSEATRKRIANHVYDGGEEGDEYGGSRFNGFADYFKNKKIKLQNLDAELRLQAEKPQLFKGIVAHVTGYTQPSLNDLHKLIVQHGGGFMQYLDGKTTVTHIIASSLTPKKAVEFKRYRIVKPAWVVDSVAAGKLLPWNGYRVIDEGDRQNVLGFDKGKITSQANVKTRGYRDQTDASWYTSQLKGSQSVPASTPTPSSSIRSRFTGRRLPTPEDAIEDVPPSHQPESAAPRREGESSRVEKIVTPPKTSPLLAPQEPREYTDVGGVFDEHDSLYAAASPQPAQLDNFENTTDQPDAQSASKGPKELSAEEHNKILLSDPQVRKSTAVDPNFLEQYYRESRLHHLSTWKADLKSQLQAMASEKSATQRANQKRPPGARRYVLHVDYDSFFAAVSLKKNPEFKDKPAVVAHGQGSGSEIASCNYPAREYGVKNGMWMKRALELCPNLKILPYDFPAYEEASRAFYDVILATGGIVQSVSIDEVLVDISTLCIAPGGGDGRKMDEGSIYREQAKADEIAYNLREQVKAKTDCNVSVGIGSNILLAKVALRKAKPAGQYQIKPEEVLDFIGSLHAQDLPTVAWSIGGKLEDIGVKYVKDIRELSKEKLVQTLGPKTGEKLYEYSRGIDRQEVGEQVVRKSVSAEVNWGIRFENQEQADEFVTNLCGELQNRLVKEKVKGKQFTMKIMRRSPDAPLDPPKHLGHGKCDTYNKSLVLGVATNSKDVLAKEALSILRGFSFITPGELRGIGLQMTKLEPMKNATDGTVESSQRRLQFKVGHAEPASTRKVPATVDDPIQDEPETPKKPRATDEHIGFGAQDLNHLTPSRRPLNTLGTQFIMPTQVDPKVLAELPDDIRSKLQRQMRQSSPTPAAKTAKGIPFPMTALPAQSQLDPEILAALPAEVRAEVLAQYAASAMPSSPSRRARHDQTLLPQSPRKNRIIGIPAKKTIVPVKRGRGRPPRSAMLAAAAQTSSVSKTGKTLMQASFISLKNPAREGRSREASAGPDFPADTMAEPAGPAKKGKNDDELDPDFLSALPEAIRKEVIEEHKRNKLQAFRLAVTRKAKAAPPVQAPRPAQKIKVPRPPKPTFTTQKLSKAKDLRVAMREWVREFADEGPYSEDVGALVKYLKKVVCEERDLAKAVGVVKWVDFVVGDTTNDANAEKWNDAMIMMKKGVTAAARERGMGAVSFN
ncbi:hypothetical protein BKA66DRAFT_469500 [Pyrenochaeta sp. MPI-SDFR-AT-0127]|nr:hypothetical protein BKA66DRAFT_469500 [Pyrenochaeta sp. MPI-SDFR-AT-0127]